MSEDVRSASSDRVWTGGCLCGAIRFEARGEPDRVVHCYCGMCRRWSGAAFVTFARFPRASVCFVEGEVTPHRSSARVVRGHCAACGGALTFAYDNEPECVWLTAGSLDRAGELEPTGEFMAEERVAWARGVVGD